MQDARWRYNPLEFMFCGRGTLTSPASNCDSNSSGQHRQRSRFEHVPAWCAAGLPKVDKGQKCRHRGSHRGRSPTLVAKASPTLSPMQHVPCTSPTHSRISNSNRVNQVDLDRFRNYRHFFFKYQFGRLTGRWLVSTVVRVMFGQIFRHSDWLGGGCTIGNISNWR